ncbi:MAG: DUF1080 domain-containing protein [Bryobacterales bacterium]|nr:DUF1080 domain-containing protein [Bryobacterales bacterium]
MKTPLLLLAALFAAFAAGDAEDGFTPMFNGKDLSGWIVDTPGLWQFKDGVIGAKSPGLKYNDFLRTEKHFGDFVLKASFRLVGGYGNSGIQFRSKPVPDSHEVSGYQADIGQQYWGCLYDESRRKKVLVQAAPENLKTLNKDGWNDYTVTAKGNRITIELNGVKTVDYTETEPGIETTGFVALQIHSSPEPSEVQFKNVRIKELR